MTNADFSVLPIEKLHESKLNPRRHFDAEKLKELTASIKAHGILTPLLVRPNASGYEIAAGHRRYRAAKAAGVDQVPAIVRPMTDVEFLEVITIENLQREDVHPLEEADGYRSLMDKAGYDVPAIAAKVGKSASYVYQRLKLAELSEPARKAFLGDEITAGHAILLARLQPKDQAEAMKASIKPVWVDRRDGGDRQAGKACVSVRELSAWIDANVHLDLHSVAFPKDDAALVAAAGSCTSCPKRTGNAPELFPDVKKGDTCTDPACFKAKKAAFVERQVAGLGVKGKPVKVAEEGYYYGRDEDDGTRVLNSHEWRRAKPDTCSTLRPAVFVDGKVKGQVGVVCVEPKCKVHFFKEERGRGSSDSSSYAKQQRAAQEKAKKESARRRAILTAVRAKITGDPLPRPVLELVIRGFWEDVWHEVRRDLVRLFGWAADGADGDKHPDALLTARLPKLDAKGLNELLVALAVGKDIHAAAYGGGQPKQLLALAKAYKVDPEKVKVEAAAPKPPTKKPVQTSAKKKAKR